MKCRSLLLTAAVLMAGLFVSCSKDEVPEEVVYEAGMTSFGFYVEDNEGVILEDYVVSAITGTSIALQLPEEVDKSSLIARFTVTENDVVKVGSTVQVSGVTANDFTVPVDYFVSEETANVKYTVTIEKAPAFVWSALPPVTSDSAVALVMKVSPAGVPYIAYKMDRESTDDEGLAVMVLNQGTWSPMGQVSEGRVATNMDIAFNSKDEPAVSYLDYTSETSQQASVKAYNGTTWSFVGGPAATTDKVTYNALEYVNDNKLMLFALFDGRSGPLTRRELSVNIFEGGSWATNSTIPGRPADHRGWLVTTAKLGDVVYVGAHNAVSPNSVSVYKYENNTFTTLLDAWYDENATGINLRDFDIDVDKDGNVYVAFADDSSEGVAKHRVLRYDAETKEITDVGNYLEGASGGLFSFDLAVSPLGVPYLFYRNASLFPTVVSLDKDTQDWTTPTVLETAEADDLSMDFGPDGKAYIVYTKNNKIFTYKYDAPGN